MNRPPTIVTTAEEVIDATLGAVTIGLVPVLGSLHEGHLAMIRRSDAENDDTIVAHVDLASDGPALSRREIGDAHAHGARILYEPLRNTIFPETLATSVHVAGLTDRWEGASGPDDLDRITTLFAILLNQLQPTRTYVGEHHVQQLAILTHVHRDLALSGDIVSCPVVRDPDGLPLSSANTALSSEGRSAALAISQALFAIQHEVITGTTDVSTLLKVGNDMLSRQPSLALGYLAIVDPETFEPVNDVAPGSRAIAAATVDGIRMLDNVYLAPDGPGHTTA